MSYLDDIVGLLGGAPAAAPAPAPSAPVAYDPGPAANAPMVITPTPQGIAAAAPATKAKSSDDWTLPATTMTPPPVAAVPFVRSGGWQAPQQLPMLGGMGGLLGAPPQPAPAARKIPMPILGMPQVGGGVVS